MTGSSGGKVTMWLMMKHSDSTEAQEQTQSCFSEGEQLAEAFAGMKPLKALKGPRGSSLTGAYRKLGTQPYLHGKLQHP